MDQWRLVKSIARGVLRRGKVLAALTLMLAAALFLPAAYYLSKEPPRFRTSATVLLESRPDRVPLFQEFSPFRPLPVQLAILNSRSLAEAVLENLPKTSLQDLVENPYYVDYVQELRNVYRRFRGVEPDVESPQRRALRELQRARMRFDASGGHGIVYIGAEASKPQVAVDIVNTYIEVLLSRTRSFNIDDARVSREFLEQQVAEVKKSLNESEQVLRAFTMSQGGVRVPERSQATVSRLSQAENALAEVEANRRMIQARLQGLREKLEQQKAAASAAGPAAPASRPVAPQVQRVREQLAKLEAALIELRTRYTDEHPRVVLVKDQIAEFQRELGAAVKETTSVSPAPGAVPPAERFNFAEQVLALETSQHALIAQEEALRKQVESLRQSLSGLSRSEIEYTRLAREQESNRSLYAMLSDKLTGARIREQGEMKVVKVIDHPGPPAPATSEKRLKFGGMALLLALALGAGVPALVELLRRPIESEEDAETATGLPVMAVVPKLRSRRPMFVSTSDYDVFENGRRLSDAYLFSEAFRNLRVAVLMTSRAENLRTILIASPYPGEGKSTVLINLGLALREAGRRVVLADTDFFRPSLHQTLDVKGNGAGLVDMLHAAGSAEHSLMPLGERMWLAPRGRSLRPDTPGILGTNRLKEVLDELASKADFVLCDSSPVLLIPDNLFLATAVDGVILVAKAGATGCGDLARTKAILEGAGARVIGVVLNEMPPSRLRRYYKRYYKSDAAAAAL